MPIRFKISTGGQTPIFRQVVDQARLAIATGKALPGEPLPSVGALAQELVVNPNTIAKAYNMLADDNLIESQPGKGLFVAKQADTTPAQRAKRIEPALEAFIQEALCLGITPQEARQLIDAKLASLHHEDPQ